jgi:hypothetical protein
MPAMGRVVTGQSADEILHLVGDFFMKKDDVHQPMRRIASRLDEEKIDYAIVGGMALSLHGYARVTEDVDLLITPAGLERIHERLVGRGYVTPVAGARKALRDTQTGIKVEFITTGEFPGDGKRKAVSFPDPRSVAVEIDDLSVIALPKLIELKLASGLTAPHRLRGLADVQDLILHLEPGRELGEQLDPSVRDEFYRMWDAAAASR